MGFFGPSGYHLQKRAHQDSRREGPPVTNIFVNLTAPPSAAGAWVVGDGLDDLRAFR